MCLYPQAELEELIRDQVKKKKVCTRDLISGLQCKTSVYQVYVIV